VPDIAHRVHARLHPSLEAGARRLQVQLELLPFLLLLLLLPSLLLLLLLPSSCSSPCPSPSPPVEPSSAEIHGIL